MHKLTSLEAQRVTSVLDSTLEKLQTLSYIPTEPDADTVDSVVGSLQESGSNNVKSCIQQLWQLEDNYRRSKESAFSNSNFGGNESGFEIGEQLHNTSRTLCRLLRKHPIAMDLLMENSSSRSPALMNVCQYLQDLAAITFRRLSTTVEEEAANTKTLRELTDKQKLSEKDREGLQQNLEFQRAEKDKEVAMLGQTISKLRAELHDITRTNEIEVANIEQSAKENVESAGDAHAARCEELKTETDKLLEAIKNRCAKNAETETALRKRKSKFENELTTKIAAYDQEMGDKQAQIEDLTAKFESEEAELKELQEHFDKVDANTATSDAEAKILAEIAAMDAAADKILGDACVVIQKRARGIIDRAIVAKLKKKKGKGKGKKGKKKK
ncbi:hypothetical protein TrST_g4801 [Triparma strigata]|uniref:Dynein regulatory complex protein 10 n=1 Tax=Triparma strigata TaxID=1606541 RepID=A0A9W7BBW6_9STRA|nr:hypothetical protein TrST_g4801 [Triparma strigata]